MAKKVTLRALDHLLMASLRFNEGKHVEAAKHMQLASEQEDYEDTIETLNAANEEGWDDEEELDDVEEAAEEELDLDADEQDEDESEEADADGDDDDLDMVIEDDEPLEEAKTQQMARAMARTQRQASRRKAEKAAEEDESEEDEAESEEDEGGEEMSSTRRIRAQANLRLLHPRKKK